VKRSIIPILPLRSVDFPSPIMEASLMSLALRRTAAREGMIMNRPVSGMFCSSRIPPA